jgi:Ca-activated chloride channel family protein
MQLYSPYALLLLLVVPLLAYLILRKKRTAAVRFSYISDIKRCPVSLRLRLRPSLAAARLVCLALLVIALARPREGTVLSSVSTEAVALQVVVDHSGSMSAQMDYFGKKLNRLEVVKEVLADFIEGADADVGARSGDLLGMVSFARYADTICPLVLSHNVLIEFLKGVQIVRLRSEDGTAIGDAIALAAARLKKAEEELKRRNAELLAEQNDPNDAAAPAVTIKSKAIVLLTDGRNNMGRYDPVEAAKMAKDWGIKIYTIGIGSAQAYTTVQTMMGSFKIPTAEALDEGLLQAIAQSTGGFYGRADDAKALKKIVEKIGQLEKTKIKSVQYIQYAEQFGPWALSAVVLLGLEILAGCTIFRKIP